MLSKEGWIGLLLATVMAGVGRFWGVPMWLAPLFGMAWILGSYVLGYVAGSGSFNVMEALRSAVEVATAKKKSGA